MNVVPMCSAHIYYIIVLELLECYNVAQEDHDKEDIINIQIPKIEGKRVVEGLELKSSTYEKPLRTRKVNIGTIENPKFVNIGYYWNNETVEKIADLLREYHDVFPTTYVEMNGIAGELGEIKIPLKRYAKPVRQRPYRMNLKYKEKVKVKIDRMLEERIIKLVVES
jgi:hypothetical protein